jgi:hypothetical protein
MITLYYGTTSISKMITLVSLYRTGTMEAHYRAEAEKLMIEAAEATSFEFGVRIFSLVLGGCTLLGVLWVSVVGL